MKIVELCQELDRLGVSKDLYSIKAVGMPNEKLCLVYEDEWKIYYSEKGKRTGEKVYLNEEEACVAFLQKMMRYSRIDNKLIEQTQTCAKMANLFMSMAVKS